jgi:hypothetical protein
MYLLLPVESPIDLEHLIQTISRPNLITKLSSLLRLLIASCTTKLDDIEGGND